MLEGDGVREYVGERGAEGMFQGERELRALVWPPFLSLFAPTCKQNRPPFCTAPQYFLNVSPAQNPPIRIRRGC